MSNFNANALSISKVEVINVKDYGVVGDGITDDTDSIQHILNRAQGKIVFFPISKNHYLIKKPLLLKSSTSIKGESDTGSKIIQTTWGMPAFEIYNEDSCLIENLLIKYEGNRLNISGGYRGNNKSSYCAGVYLNGHNSAINNVNIEGFVCGVFLTNYNLDNTNSFQTLAKNNIVRDINVNKVDFGVLITGQIDLEIENIYGTCEQSQKLHPSHLVYVGGKTERAIIKNCYANNINSGAAFQFRMLNNSFIYNLNAESCSGIVSIIDCKNNTLQKIRSILDTSPNYSFYFQRGKLGSYNNTIDSLFIHKSATGSVHAISIDGQENVIKNVHIFLPKVFKSSVINRINGGKRNQVLNWRIDLDSNKEVGTMLKIRAGHHHVVKRIEASNFGLLIQVHPQSQNNEIDIMDIP
ncbi:glycosyl hydrolase family 28-related protein [Parapedobacter composti]|nr:glycosyl hydrolase family 28-related protein [Parapedobacter composti]